MAYLPTATIIIDDEAGAQAQGTETLTVIGAVEMNGDITPRVFASTKAILAKHGYSEAVDYCALHFEETKKPILFVGLPKAIAGTISAVETTGNTGTSVITVSGGTNGVLDACNASVTIVTGGTIGTDQIVFDLSLDGGRNRVRVRLGLALVHVIPYLGMKINFAAGTLVAGDIAATWTSTAPRWGTAALSAAREALAMHQRASRSWLIVGDLEDENDANTVVTEINAYATANDRCLTARTQVHDPAAGELDSDWVADIDAEFGPIATERRINLGAGRGAKLSPITGWRLRRPVQWAASLREYQHDVQIPTYRKSDGPCSGWTLEDTDGNTIEHDERVDGGLLLARFTCFRTFANGPLGAFIALDLTRAQDGSLLTRNHNMAVANIACNVAQAETENALGQILEVNADGTGTEASLAVIDERVNTALAIALLQRGAEGVRASDAKWAASRTDILNIPGAELTGILDLRLNGTLEKITTRVHIPAGGAVANAGA